MRSNHLTTPGLLMAVASFSFAPAAAFAQTAATGGVEPGVGVPTQGTSSNATTNGHTNGTDSSGPVGADVPPPPPPPPPPIIAGRHRRTQERARAAESTPVIIRMRFDTFFRGVPRYVLTAQSGAASADDRYWNAITMAPLQQRVALDATGLINGHAEAHLAAWGAIDLAAPAVDGRIAGDVAVAWVGYHRGPAGLWAGRRFMAWGAPGGVHLDAVGANVEMGGGFTLDAVFGRPVTPVYAPTLTACSQGCGPWLGGHPGFDGVTAAGGARLGWSMAGHASAALSYLEHWAQGIPARRVVEASFLATPLRWLDARGSISFDLLGLGVMQADLDLAAWVGRKLEVDVGYGHLNPQLLIPRYSILSVFVTREFDEGRARVAWRVLPILQIGVEGGLQHYDVPGRTEAQFGSAWGGRADVWVRFNTTDRRAQLLAMASHRDDGSQRMTLIRLAGSFPIVRDYMGALEAAVALDNDDWTAARTSYYGRATVDGPITPALRLGASIDGVRSPIAASELRGMIHLTARLDMNLGGRR